MSVSFHGPVRTIFSWSCADCALHRQGNAYGLANTLLQTAVFRPPLRSPRLANLYFAGQLTVPGPGMPPAIIRRARAHTHTHTPARLRRLPCLVSVPLSLPRRGLLVVVEPCSPALPRHAARQPRKRVFPSQYIRVMRYIRVIPWYIPSHPAGRVSFRPSNRRHAPGARVAVTARRASRGLHHRLEPAARPRGRIEASRRARQGKTGQARPRSRRASSVNRLPSPQDARPRLLTPDRDSTRTRAALRHCGRPRLPKRATTVACACEARVRAAVTC